jgi:hypothetical protein
MGADKRLTPQIIFALELAAYACMASAQCVSPASTMVKGFAFTGSRVEALVALGQRERVCFAIRNLPREAFFTPVVIDVKSKSVLDVVRDIVPESAIEVRPTSSNLIEVFRVSNSPALFERTIADYSIGRVPVQTASVGLQLRLARELDPSIQGFAGDLHPGDETDLVGPFSEHGQTVQRILNLIVARSKGGCWLATMPDDYKPRTSPASERLWTIIQYARPFPDIRAIIADIAASYPPTKGSTIPK